MILQNGNCGLARRSTQTGRPQRMYGDGIRDDDVRRQAPGSGLRQRGCHDCRARCTPPATRIGRQRPMKAAVLWTTGEPFDVTDVELGRPLGDDEVLVRVSGVGMCHTDLLHRDPPLPPIILGHEGSGVVEKVGAAVTAVAVGDHVLASFDSCGSCHACLTGQPSYCVEFESRNVAGGHTDAVASSGRSVAHRWFGQSSFAEFAVCTQRNLVVVDSDLPLPILGPFGCGFQTGAGAVLNDMRMAPGQSIAIFGAGAVGLAAVMAARLAGAAEIVVADRVDSRLNLALELGATRVVRAGAENLLGEVIGKRRGVDFSLDTTAVPSCISAALEVLDRPGRAVLVGGGGSSVPVSPRQLSGRQLTFVLEGNAVPQLFLPKLIDFWRRGLFPFERLVRTYPLEAINEAAADSRSGTTIKPILIP